MPLSLFSTIIAHTLSSLSPLTLSCWNRECSCSLLCLTVDSLSTAKLCFGRPSVQSKCPSVLSLSSVHYNKSIV